MALHVDFDEGYGLAGEMRSGEFVEGMAGDGL